jgi:hypothetical protein
MGRVYTSIDGCKIMVERVLLCERIVLAQII